MKHGVLIRPGSFFAAFVFAFTVNSFAAGPDIPASQTAGGVEQQQKELEKGKALEKTIEGEKAKPSIEEKTLGAAENAAMEKVFVTQIRVEGAILLSETDIRAITAQYENKELSLAEIKKVADLITDAYRTKGYPTTRAFIPPQSIGENGVVVVKVVEGVVGTVTVTGNKHFTTELIKNKLGLKEKEPFNYSALQKALTSINERQDRFAKVVLLPGKAPGETDILVEVQDSLPIHFSYTYDNYGSRYVGRSRHGIALEHNNLLGMDDQLYLEFQRSNRAMGLFYAGRYLYPVNDTLNVGLTASYARTKLGKEFEPLDAVGKATVVGVFLNKALLTTDDLDVRLNAGFDYKRIRNSILGTETSRDDGRVAKLGFDVDNRDPLGRTLLTAEFDQGIPEIMGGLDAKDPRASRAGSGGKFSKGVFNLYRAQPLPFSTSLLLKNSAQFTNNALTAAEEFQLGGPYSVRGYAPGEYAGDRGLYSAAELSLPYYFIPKSWEIPYAKTTWYDASRFVMFYDWGTVRLNNAQEGEAKSRTLNSCGLGFRFDITNRLSAKAEFGYPIGGPKSSDSKNQHVQPWIEFNLKI